MELDREKLREVLAHWEKARRAARDGLPFREAMRLLAGTALSDGEPAAAPERGDDWSRVVAGEWLAATLERLRRPEALAAAEPGAALRTTLRPYQEIGVRWLWFLTTYGHVPRLPWIGEVEWDLVVLDEAQAIKNPSAQQARAVKRLRSRARVALTGTPIENRLSDLWSLFDFLNPGLLGSARAFTRVTRELAAGGDRHYGPLRALVRPYILRRLKTDRQVIADLPDKTEMRAYCPLTRKQAALYQQAVEELERRLGDLTEMERRGTILATLLRLKQICNHPSQWLGDGAYAPDESGKFARLAELGEELSLRQEKVLVFTQFREMTGPLSQHLGRVFGRAGLVLHGQTPVKERMTLVERFQADETVPFFVLSLRAGGTGLNLTAASQVIHFDRWWNPAVESQATDRAFRIGQQRNVLVHTFVCRGTVEERIDALIEQKKGLAADLLEADGATLVTEMSDADVVRMVSLDLRSALADE